jgi:hypothetical protein
MNRKDSFPTFAADPAVVAGLVLAILWFCQDLIFRGEVPFFRDLGSYFYPLRLSVAESFRARELPLWDRRLAQGFPILAALQPGVFYPPHLLLAVVPFFSGIRLLFVFHFIIAAVGTYKLVRYWKYPPAIATIGALTFSLGGTLVSLSNLLNHFQSAVWLPWVLLTWRQLLGAPSWRKFLLFTITSALQFLAGSPEFFAMSMLLLVVDCLRFRKDQGLSPMLSFSLLGGAIFLMAAICMVQILPTAELFLHSRRQHPIPTGEAVWWSLNPINLVNLFFLDREIDLGLTTGVRYFLASRAPFFITYYMGSASFLGIILCLYNCPRREKVIAGSVISAFLILALGSWTPVYPFLLHHIPWLAAFRYPEKFFFLTYAGLLFIAIRGLGYVFDRDDDRTKPTLILLGCACLFWVGAYSAALFKSAALGNLIADRTGESAASAATAGAVVSLLSNLERQVLLTVAISLLIFLAQAGKLKPWLVKILLVGVVFVDLASANKGFLFSIHPDVIVKSSDENIHQASGISRTFYYPAPNNLHPSFVSGKGSPTFRGSVALWFRNLLPNAGIFYGAEYMQEIDALARKPYTTFLIFANELEPQAQIRLLRAFNVGQVVSFQPLSISGLSLVRNFPENYSWLYKVERPVPRAYIVNRRTVEKDAMRTLQRLTNDDFDPTREVLLDREIHTGSQRSPKAKAKILRYENTFVTIEAETNDDGILVFLDSYYPGWKAYVDGRETSIVRANHFYRAVPVPRGKHRVEFKYEPLSFKIGLIISSVAVFLIVGVSIVLFFRKRRSSLRRWVPLSASDRCSPLRSPSAL